MEILIGIGIFITTILIIEGIFFSYQGSREPEARRVRRRLRTMAAGGYEREDVDILRKTVLSDIPWLDHILLSLPMMFNVSRFLEQANAPYRFGFYLLLSVLLAPVGYIAATYLTDLPVLRVVIALMTAAVPFLYLAVKKKQRMEKFERQLPDALDLIARALKAGHAFSSGLKMTADEFDDPIGTEFGKTLDEINFGVGVGDALKGLADRVACPDLKFFVVSVIIQRETGGNLAEIMESLARLIRERFKLQGRVKVLAAEGKLSAIILVLLPFTIGFYFFLVQPTYVGILFTDKVGRYMMAGALIMMVLGSLVIRRMVRIRV